jgi:hypothetical protein
MGDQDPMDKETCAFGPMDISDDDVIDADHRPHHQYPFKKPKVSGMLDLTLRSPWRLNHPDH